jgi:eukaryotic-like serine/threonine-protein kinase
VRSGQIQEVIERFSSGFVKVTLALPHKRLIGPYTLIELLGKGSMGSVYRAFHSPTRKHVALKVMALDPDSPRDKKERFYREAQLASQLEHPHIIKIYDVGEEEGQIYLSMELLTGRDLKAVLNSTDQVTLHQRLIWITELTQTFAYAHEKGIVHRDIKPSNVWVRQDQSTVVMDFGIARPPFSDITRAGIILGTPDYISPEQILSIRVDQRTDIFLLGLLFYQLLTQAHPFLGETQAATAHNLLNEDPIPPRSINPEIAEPINEMILKCLNKNMNFRPQSCAEILSVL